MFILFWKQENLFSLFLFVQILFTLSLSKNNRARSNDHPRQQFSREKQVIFLLKIIHEIVFFPLDNLTKIDCFLPPQHYPTSKKNVHNGRKTQAKNMHAELCRYVHVDYAENCETRAKMKFFTETFMNDPVDNGLAKRLAG